ncbi:MAG: hypothetical protein AAGF78_09085 [Pseudomonadota bacterium]
MEFTKKSKTANTGAAPRKSAYGMSGAELAQLGSDIVATRTDEMAEVSSMAEFRAARGFMVELPDIRRAEDDG